LVTEVFPCLRYIPCIYVTTIFIYIQNKKLLEEKEGYLQTLFEQVREQEANLRQARKVSRTEVEAALLEKMDYLNSSMQEIKGIVYT